MPFEFLDDEVTSDVTFHAWAPDVEQLFAAAADATTQVMVGGLDRIAPRLSRAVEVEATALDLLLARFLDELVFLKDAQRLLLRPRTVRIARDTTPLRVRAELVGEPIDPARHELGADVKAVTLHGLRVEQRADVWHAQVTLDI